MPHLNKQEESANYLHVDENAIECAHCKPESGYLDAEKEYGIKCNCKCHLSSDTNREWAIRKEWNKFLRENPTYTFGSNKVRDWWLNKLQEELTRERETAYKQGVRDGKKDILDAMRKMVETL